VSAVRLRRRGRPIGSWVRLVDVTRVLELEQEHRDLEARLRRAERLESLGVLAAGIAHEINNPAGSILLAAEHAQRALRENGTGASAEEALETIVAEAKRCGRIVRNVLKFAREEPSEKWPIDPNLLVRRAAERVAKRAEEEGVRFVVSFAFEPPAVRANATDLEQALVNLLENALDAGSAGMCLELSTHVSPRGVRFVVRDDGPGMSEEVRARAFEPFFSTKSDRGGTGLGLSLVHGIVREHGGVLEFGSEPGQGTCVAIELPPAREGVEAGLLPS
jgi:two-component system NtrC family sensor kinase